MNRRRVHSAREFLHGGPHFFHCPPILQIKAMLRWLRWQLCARTLCSAWRQYLGSDSTGRDDGGPHTEAALRWEGGRRFAATTAHGDLLIESGTERTSISPMEALLSAVAGCMAVDVVDILGTMREPIAGYSVRCEAWRAQTDPRRFVRIRLTHYCVGTSLDETKVRRAVDLSQSKYCSAMASLDPAMTIENVIQRDELA